VKTQGAGSAGQKGRTEKTLLQNAKFKLQIAKWALFLFDDLAKVVIPAQAGTQNGPIRLKNWIPVSTRNGGRNFCRLVTGPSQFALCNLKFFWSLTLFSFSFPPF
jgi:hypothetical protein